MTDTSPQAVFGFNEEQIRKLIREEYAARDKGPGRVAVALGYLFDRLKEPTSYAGLGVLAVPLLSRFGVTLSDDQWGMVIQLAVAGAGFLAFALKERGQNDQR